MTKLLDRDVASLKGVGEATRPALQRLGLYTWGDVLHHYPRRYEDYSQLVRIRDAKLGPITVVGTIEHIASRRSVRSKLKITEAIISDGTGTLKCVWFNQSYLEKSIQTGTSVSMSGKLEFRGTDLSLQSPLWERITPGAAATGKIVPIYPETHGLSSKQLAGFAGQVLNLLVAQDIDDLLPADIVAEHSLLPIGEALRFIHKPQSMEELEEARQRLAFEELFMLQAASAMIKNEIKTETAPAITFDETQAKEFVAQLPFKLTDGQRQSAWKILQDIGKARPMNRLLEGDVGSGKTVVAAMAAAQTCAAGYQVALMVPTEILARQHAASLAKLLAPKVQVELLVASQPKPERAAVEKRLQSGEPLLVIGTQALLSDRATFSNLGMVVVDEQHRFGVGQRQTLKSKAGQLPHLLSMTATPIPRTLKLTIYGDLDISILRELPAGRKPAITKVIPAIDRSKMYAAIDEQLAAGRQAFIVCPLIEPSDMSGARSVKAEAARLQKTVFKHRRLGVLHGKLPADEKQAIMDSFVRGELDMLIATTVIEVGVDVPNATVMLVEGAERFGLAALHQLRGRVGRGTEQAYCYLAPTDNTATSVQRLQAMERTTDGFRLAQIDLELRGPGQIYGLRQHGTLDLRFAGLDDTELIAATRQAAERFVAEPATMLQYPKTLERIESLRAVTSLD